MTSLAAHPRRLARRSFLQVGAAGLAGFSLVDLLRAERAAGIKSSHKAVVFVHLDGGPPHQDMIDLKTEAPVEIRGEFKPIATNVPGLEVCELLPRLAQTADRYAFIRSLTASAGAHDGFQCFSGFPKADLESIGGRPTLGCVVTKLLGRTTDVAPSFVDMTQGRPMVRNSARPGFLGPTCQAFRPDLSHLFARDLEAGMKSELARRNVETVSYELNRALNAARVDDRMQLLARLDRVRRDVDAGGMMEAMDGFSQQAVGILTSGRLAKALDLTNVDAATLARYTPPSSSFDAVTNPETGLNTNDDVGAVRKFLLARKLIEAGVRCVTLTISDFDTHRNNFSRLRHLLPIVDAGLDAFTSDLADRGLTDDVSIVVWGEFGRTPKVNTNGGRDHWPGAGMCLLSGGGMRTGQVIGSTDRYGAVVTSRPVRYPDVFATLYRNLGIDYAGTTLVDPSGRPQHLTLDGAPLPEVA
jgi:hypothetical protein